jgi:hypothetical protein
VTRTRVVGRCVGGQGWGYGGGGGSGPPPAADLPCEGGREYLESMVLAPIGAHDVQRALAQEGLSGVGLEEKARHRLEDGEPNI